MEKFYVYHSHEDFEGRRFIPWNEIHLTEQLANSELDAKIKVKEKYPFDEIYYVSLENRMLLIFGK